MQSLKKNWIQSNIKNNLAINLSPSKKITNDVTICVCVNKNILI